jgi:hypothetical protein
MSRPLATAVFAIAMAFAAAAEPGPILEGIYNFVTTAEKDGKPVCTETWTFNGKTMSVQSGEEISQATFRTETDVEGSSWLISKTTKTNGKPDCMGKSATGTPEQKPENRIYFFVRNSGSIALCPAPTRAPDGSLYTGDCWGEATPVY